MTNMNKKRTVKRPRWIDENLPEELVESSLFRFRVKLTVNEPGKEVKPGVPKKKTIEVDIIPELDLDYQILEDQMQDLPAQYAFYATVYSESKFWVSLAERALKAARGNAVRAIQTRAAQDKVRFTAEQIKTVLEAEQDVIDADTKLQMLQMQTGKLYHMLEALRMKAELARSLAGFKRQEYEKSE